MAFDGLFCAAAARELNAYAGARVEKIYQSSQSCFFFQIYSEGRHLNLIISASASKPILSVTADPVAKPDDPTPLCMLYRKHLQNARISGVDRVENERIVRFAFDSADEMGYIRKKYIYAEMMGKYSNIILVSEEGRIIAASSTTDITGTVRQITPGLPYELPPKQEKISAADISREGFKSYCADKYGMRISDMTVRGFFAFSPLIAREVAFRACGDTEAELCEGCADRVFDVMKSVIGFAYDGGAAPTAVFDAEGRGIEYSFMPLAQYPESLTRREYPDTGSLLNDFFGKREESINISRYSRELMHTVKNDLARAIKKLGLLKEELAECGKMDSFRIKGDVITANIYRVKQGDTALTAVDYESGNEITVRLEKELSPSRNAQKYYKQYEKMKRASVSIAEQIEKTKSECSYLESVVGFIERAASPAELSEIKLELQEGGYIPFSGGKPKKRTPASKPLTFVTSGGLTVRVGRNNRQNDALTGSASKNDLWFHIKGFHGSHVILSAEGIEPSDADYTESAMLAAYYSEKRGSDNVGVDYTRVRNLKKPNGSAPGFVTYEKYYTAFVDAKDPYEKK